MKYISPSLLGFDKEKIEQQIKTFKNSNITSIHYDVMDNIYVPNTSFEFEYLTYIQKQNIPIDVHLMCQNVLPLVEKYFAWNVRSIAVHPDADSWSNVGKALDLIQNTNRIAPALALKNNQILIDILPFLKKVKYVIAMGVNPGFGGQTYLLDTTKLLQDLCKIRTEYNLHFSIILDGGVTTEIIKQTKSYVDIFVSGSFLMKQEKFLEFSDKLFESINS